MENFINVQNLCKTFPGQPFQNILSPFSRSSLNRTTSVTLDDISFTVHTGEVFGLLGPNGAGKTTLLKILSCLILPSSGTVTVAGNDIIRNAYAVRNSIGLVSGDERSFYWRLSGRQNLEFFGIFYNLSPKAARKRSAELMDLLGIEEPDKMVNAYSSGMKQRLALARALLHDPPILFMDEPTKSLDPTSVKKFHHFVSSYLCTEKGKTILWATHNLNEAERLCQRIAILKKGKIIAAGSLDALRKNFDLQPSATLEDIFTIADTGGTCASDV